MSLAADTREAVRTHPFIHTALRAGVLNHAAAAEWLREHDADLDGDPDAIATAIRRFTATLDSPDRSAVRANVSMDSGVAVVDRGGDAARSDREPQPSDQPLATVGPFAVVPDGDRTAVRVTGDVDPTVLRHLLDRLWIADIDVVASAIAGDTCLVVVDRRAGADAVRILEDALTAVPDRRS